MIQIRKEFPGIRGSRIIVAARILLQESASDGGSMITVFFTECCDPLGSQRKISLAETLNQKVCAGVVRDRDHAYDRISQLPVIFLMERNSLFSLRRVAHIAVYGTHDEELYNTR